jgi:ATP-binding cassette subfamily C (CFTR/MRP) protein 10
MATVLRANELLLFILGVVSARLLVYTHGGGVYVGVMFVASLFPVLAWFSPEPLASPSDHLYESLLADGSVRTPLTSVFFLWFTPLLNIGASRQLQMSDLPLLRPDYLSSEWHARFKAHLAGYVSLWAVCGRLFLKPFGFLGFLKLVNTMLGFVGPLLLHALVSYIEDSDDGARVSSGVVLVVLMGVSAAASAFVSTQFSFRVGMLQMNVRSSFLPTLFDIALQLRECEWTYSGLSTAEVINLMSVDTQKIMDVTSSLHELWSLPLQVLVTFALLYWSVSYAFFVGVALVVVMVPLNLLVARAIGRATEQLMIRKDRRTRVVSEALSGIKSVKMLALETWLVGESSKEREEEMKYQGIRKYLDAVCVFLWANTPLLVPYATFLTSTLSGNKPSAADVFLTVALLNMLIYPMNAFPWVINGIMEALVSERRIRRIVKAHRRNDVHIRDTTTTNAMGVIQLVSTVFSWDFEDILNDRRRQDNAITSLRVATRELSEYSQLSGSDISQAQSANGFAVGPISLRAQRGEVIGVCGVVGSGKSSLLLGILEEITLASGTMSLLGNVSFCAQVPQLLNRTIRENIVGDELFRSERYAEVIQGCGLSRDLATITGGDRARVGM